MRTIGVLCSLIVGLQILVGVPLLVCLAFYVLAGSGEMAPVTVEMHAGRHAPPHDVMSISAVPAMPPCPIGLPPNVIPQQVVAPLENPILESRAQHGSPLAGTLLSEAVTPDVEEQLFTAAFEKISTENATPTTADSLPEPPQLRERSATPRTDDSTETYPRDAADRFAVRRLYAMAQMDERAGEYARADQWRSLAREIRQQMDARPTLREPANPQQ
jgi:hypothetical protein